MAARQTRRSPDTNVLDRHWTYGQGLFKRPHRSLLGDLVLLQIARDAEYLQKNVLQPAAASNGGQPDKPQKFLDRVKSLRTMHSGHSKPPSKAVSFPSGSQVQGSGTLYPWPCAFAWAAQLQPHPICWSSGLPEPACHQAPSAGTCMISTAISVNYMQGKGHIITHAR